MKAAANELVITTPFNVLYFNADSRTAVFSSMGGFSTSFSTALAPTIRGEAMWARCVAQLSTETKASGAVMSGINKSGACQRRCQKIRWRRVLKKRWRSGRWRGWLGKVTGKGAVRLCVG